MTIGEVCNREVIITDEDSSVIEAAQLMREMHVGDLIVVKEINGENHPVGIVTDRDLVVEVLAQEVNTNGVAIRDVMTRDPQAVGEEMNTLEALKQMRQLGVRRMPVVNDRGGLVGILTVDDALSLIHEALDNLVALVGREIDNEIARR
ncbi:MAG TPA: CBS domain-containing protein [Gammaproteobacteria bacterium]|nr:CBS domain-containing protein [Gammaproteobacteria bacterium]